MATAINQQLILNGFLSTLDQQGKVQVEYIWLGGLPSTSGRDLRSKSRTVNGPVNSVADLPEWNYDGSSTRQASGHKSEIVIRPRAIFRDPFRGGDNLLAMCDTYFPNGEPTPDNTRLEAEKIFNQDKGAEPWFGIEQEYVMYTVDRHPLGWPTGGFPAPQGPYYCGAGADRAFGRPLVEAHYKACLHAGLHISGINAEVMPGQWEFQIGPATGISAGDELWVARYLLHRLGEVFNIVCSFDPKPVTGDWNGSGCHTNYSTKDMREKDNGFEIIKAAIERLGKKHDEHIRVYGTGNERRLTGHHETSPIDKFAWGVGDRGGSIRVPNQTEKDGRGYFEDRRPASNMDPYVVTSKIFLTTHVEAL